MDEAAVESPEPQTKMKKRLKTKQEYVLGVNRRWIFANIPNRSGWPA